MDTTYTVNIFLRAKTPEELVELQLLNNQANNIMFAYQTPVWTGKDWVVWFFADVPTWVDPKSWTPEVIKRLGTGR